MADKARSSREDVLQFLDSLDSDTAPGVPSSGAGAPSSNASTAAPAAPNAEEAQSMLDFLDEIAQRSSTPTASVARANAGETSSPARKAVAAGSSSTLGGAGERVSALSRSQSRQTNVLAAVDARKSSESARSAGRASAAGGASPARASPVPQELPATPSPAPAAESSGGGWGWGSVWNQASSIVQQARTVAEEQVRTATQGGGVAGGLAAGIGAQVGGLMKAVEGNEQAQKWREGVLEYARGAHLDQIGKDLKSTTLKSLTDLLNAVAPPISEHEVIQVSLSHDMLGYDGIETLVYRSLAKVMEQVEGGTLIVNKGNEEKPKDDAEGDERDLNAVSGLAEAWKLAEANLEQLIKTTYKPVDESAKDTSDNSLTVPVTVCPVYMRVQPCLAPLPYLNEAAPSADGATTPALLSPEAGKASKNLALFFILILRDPGHNLVHSSLSQSMPAAWLDIPFEENEWVEDVMVEIIRRSIEIVGTEYVTFRARAQAQAISKAREEAQAAVDNASKVATAPNGAEATGEATEAIATQPAV